MNNRILNEVKRNRELMGLNESEVDEQLGTAIRKGIEKGKEFVKDKIIDPIKDRLDGTSGTLDGTREGVEAGKEMSSNSFVMRQGEDGKWNWVEGDVGENENTTKKVFDDYVIYSRTGVPSNQRSQVQQFIMDVARTYDNLTELLSNEEVAKLLNTEYQEERPLNPQVTQGENRLYNYSYYFKK